ncbi:MAG: S-layer homology domain-containing protein [Clostridiales bacterium]|nr:S-layer homology domain-containing protein [Clostridiales bacterium]
MKIKRQQFQMGFFQMLFLASLIFMSSFVYADELIELEFGNEALDEYKTYPLEEGYVYESLDEKIVTIKENLLIANRFGDTKLIVKQNDEIIKEIEVVVYFVGDELTPWSAATINRPYISGYPDKTFRPKNFMTRAEVATVFAELLQLEHHDTVSFMDLNESHWGYESIQSVIEQEVMLPRSKDEFFPDAYITRAEMATIICKFAYMKSLELSGDIKTEISDINVDDVFYLDVHKMINVHLMTLEGSKFLPEAFIKREDVIRMINEITCRKIESISQQNFLDVTMKNDNYLQIYAASKYTP